MLDKQIMHHIQRDLLRTLLFVPSARFKDLKPASMESNIFMYHLKMLIKNDYVEKTDDGYALTSMGKHYVDRANLESLHVRIQPKIITIVVLERADGKLAILERLHQPFIGFKGFPSGKVHYGESLLDAANRELQEKTGLTGIDLHLRGNFVMKFSRNNEVVNHIVGYVYYGNAPVAIDLAFTAPLFRSYWGDRQELRVDNRFKGHPEIFELLEKTPAGQLFIAEHEFTSAF